MTGTRNDDSPTEDAPLPSLHIPKHYDYAPQTDPQDLPDVDRENIVNDTQDHDHSDTDSTGTGTDFEDDFDWEAEDDALSMRQENTTTAKRGRAVYRAFMKLSRPLRTLLVAVLGTGILITPLLVFELRFKNTPNRVQAHVWSLWLAISWAAACGTYLIVDAAPTFALGVFRLFSHKVERIQITVEVCSTLYISIFDQHADLWVRSSQQQYLAGSSSCLMSLGHGSRFPLFALCTTHLDLIG